ncbi:MFS transporter [Sphingobium aromaticivastans]|uniref:MFS transporter n=1 Tax=Sphingobium aromaticivastans TaxID=1778665 RepID=UPI0030166EC9
MNRMSTAGGYELPYIRRGTRAYRRAFWGLLLGGLSTFNLLYCVQPLMPIFSRHFAVGADATALSLSLTTAMLALAMLGAAPLADRFGRKPMMLASLLASSLLVLAGSLLDNWLALLATRALLGLSLAGLPAIAMTYLAEEIEPAALNAAMGVYIGGNALGGVIARLMNGAVADLFSWRAALAMSGLLGLLGSLIIWRILPRSRVFVPVRHRDPQAGGAYRRHLRNPFLLLLLVEGALLSGILVTTCNLLGYRLVAAPFHMSVALTSLIFVSYLLGAPTTIFAGRLAGKIGRSRILMGGLALILAGTGLMTVERLPAIAAGLGLLATGFFAAHSSASALISVGADQAKAQAASLYLFSFYAGSGVISWFGGHVWIWGQWPAVTAYLVLLTLVGFASAARLGSLIGRVASSKG